MAESYRAYNPPRGAQWNYGGSNWKLSRSKLDLFVECPLCFYLDNKLGVARPRGPSFTLNIAVDALLKKEFDAHRAEGTRHPLMAQYGVDAVPYDHEDMEAWRENFVGIQYRHPGTGLLITGAVDDVWVNPRGELIVVDYKATSKDGKVEKLSDSGWDEQYKRQMEIYQWLLRQKGFAVSKTGYFVYVNGRKDKKAFDGKLEFDVTLIPHTAGDDSWVEELIIDAKHCLDQETVPRPSSDCDFCRYRKVARDVQSKDMPKKTVARVSKKKKDTHDDTTTNSLF